MTKASRTEVGLLAFLTVAVLFRSALFVFAGRLHFDSDEAIFGLMAKHLSEGSGLPIFMYGQQYLLAVTSWVAAPLFFIFGPSLAALRLPSLVLNVAVPFALIYLARKEMGLKWYQALAAVIFLVLPSVAFAKQLTETSCAHIEMYAYIVAFWCLRERPIWLGLLLGFGTAHREFTAFGFGGLMLVQWASGRKFKELFKTYLPTVLAAAAVIIVVKLLAPLGSNYFGITTPLQPRFGLWRFIEAPLWIVQQHLAHVMGYWEAYPQPWRWLSAVALVPIGLWVLAQVRHWFNQPSIATYLIFTAFVSALAYTLGASQIRDPGYFRYNSQIILLPIGLVLLFFKLPKPLWLVRAGWVAIGFWTLTSAVSNARFLADFLREPPPDPDQELIDTLLAEGITYGTAPYWTAYRVSFRSGEKLRLLNEQGNPRILSYREASDAERARGVSIKDMPCEGGRRIAQWCVFPLPN